MKSLQQLRLEFAQLQAHALKVRHNDPKLYKKMQAEARTFQQAILLLESGITNQQLKVSLEATKLEMRRIDDGLAEWLKNTPYERGLEYMKAKYWRERGKPALVSRAAAIEKILLL